MKNISTPSLVLFICMVLCSTVSQCMFWERAASLYTTILAQSPALENLRSLHGYFGDEEYEKNCALKDVDQLNGAYALIAKEFPGMKYNGKVVHVKEKPPVTRPEKKYCMHQKNDFFIFLNTQKMQQDQRQGAWRIPDGEHHNAIEAVAAQREIAQIKANDNNPREVFTESVTAAVAAHGLYKGILRLGGGRISSKYIAGVAGNLLGMGVLHVFAKHKQYSAFESSYHALSKDQLHFEIFTQSIEQCKTEQGLEPEVLFRFGGIFDSNPHPKTRVELAKKIMLKRFGIDETDFAQNAYNMFKRADAWR